ncbi:VanZ family protein [Bacillus sp. FJAT-27445]|uniref:VanZ family protein n=1 Tax=Bacillus sp. FJAT-27445 TaxID=1679166 RepID=UPI0009E7C5E0
MVLRFKKVFIWTCFSLYLFVLFYLLFFSAYRNGVRGIIAFNLVPFQTIGRYFANFKGLSPWMVTDEFFGNILAFLPFGFFMPFFFQQKKVLKRVALSSFLLSFAVEAAQFTFRVGAFDVDDIILNTIGGAAGYVVWLFLYRRRRCRKIN